MNPTYPIVGAALVTGCGGDIGIAIARILRTTGAAGQLIGCDIHDDHPGPAYFDRCAVVARCTAPEYWEDLERLVSSANVDVIILASEQEIRLFAERRVNDVGGVPVIKASDNALAVGFDKLATSQKLREWDLPYPATVDASAGLPARWPAILKSRFGSGSKTVRIVETVDDAPPAECLAGSIWQELLLPADEEYTCGLYGPGSGDVRSIVFRRRLAGGLTGSGVVVRDPEIESLLVTIARKLDLRGSINVQLRKVERGPVVFEINPRFSSTVMFRHMFGFLDVIWSLQELLGEEPSAYSPLEVGAHFYRVGSEIILPRTHGHD